MWENVSVISRPSYDASHPWYRAVLAVTTAMFRDNAPLDDGSVLCYIARHRPESQRIGIDTTAPQVTAKVSKFSGPTTANFIVATGAGQPLAFANCSASFLYFNRSAEGLK